MKFIVIKDNFKKGISAVEKITGENLNLPILKNILIETDNNKIKITSTNLEVSITSFVLGKIIEAGKITAPTDLVSNLINNIESERLNIEKKGNKIQIKTDNYEALIQGLPADDFPITPKIKNQEEFLEIKSEILKDALNQVLISAQFSDLRPELNSVLVDFSLNSMKLATTDSFRLSEKIINSDKFNTNYKKGFKILIPLKTAKEVVRILNDGEPVKIYNDGNQVLFKTEQLEFLSRLIDGNFPDYGAIIPQKFNMEMFINKEDFLRALKLVGVFGSKNSEVKIIPQENKKVVELTSSDQSLGENRYILPAKIQGKHKEIIFNWRYVVDVLRVLKNDEVFLGVNDDNEPAQIKSVGDASYFYILKPIASD
jgi:DNA polymerase-3 subunit beta